MAPKAIRNAHDVCLGDFAQLDNVVAPVVDNHFGERDVAEHGAPLALRDGNMRAEGGHDVHGAALVAEVVPEDVCDEAGVGVEAGEVRRDDKDAPQRAPLNGLCERRRDIIAAHAKIG